MDDDELRLGMTAMRAIGYPAGSVMLLALYTGRRLRELTRMPWDEVDLDRGLHVLPAARAKNHKTHTFPLSPAVVEILRDAEARKIGAGKFVFHHGRDTPIADPDKSVLRKIDAAIAPATAKHLDPAQRTEVSMHVFRHTAATHLEMLDCPIEVCAAILNHAKPGGVTGGYGNADPLPKMRLWLDKLADHYTSPVELAKAS